MVGRLPDFRGGELVGELLWVWSALVLERLRLLESGFRFEGAAEYPSVLVRLLL
jgi:hypothetical protein